MILATKACLDKAIDYTNKLSVSDKPFTVALAISTADACVPDDVKEQGLAATIRTVLIV